MKINQKNLKIDVFQSEDLNELVEVFSFPWTSFEATKAKWETYLSEQKVGDRIVCIARWKDQIIGYGSLLKNSKYLNFKSCGIPEIHDVWISEEYRSNGFGKQLICHLEWLARKEEYQTVGIGIGLYKDYRRAQRLYIQLGYIPDGEGVTYQYQAATPGSSYPLNDDLVIWLKKELPTIISSERDNYYLERQEEPIPQDEQVLFDGISNDAAKKKGMERIKPFRIYIKDSDRSVLGGASGVTYYGCLYVDMLWVEESIRSQGFCKKIMEEAEKIAKERKCIFATLNTMDWEALPFYQKLGYSIEFVREGYDKASKMYMLRKKL
jgi:ribosomal protein S18 acetylase RimI-like enzyme